MKTLEIIGDNHFEKWTKHRIAARGIVISEDKILLLRRKAGLSQTDLAEKLGVTSQAVSKWECGVSHA